MHELANRLRGPRVMITGRNPATNTTFENIMEGSIALNWRTVFDTAYAIDMCCANAADTSAGTGAKSVRIYGLGEDFKWQTEDLVTNGQSTAYVTSTKKFFRVFGADVVTHGTGRTNAGIIYLLKTGTGDTITTGVPATLTSQAGIIQAGFSTMSTGMYTVPIDSKGMVVVALQADARAQAGTLQLLMQSTTGTDQSIHQALTAELGTTAPLNILFIDDLKVTLEVEPLTDIYPQVLTAAANGFVSFRMSLEPKGLRRIP